MKTSEQTDKLWPAIVKARQAMKHPTKDSVNPHFKSKYADLAAVLDVVDEACAPLGLVTLQELTGDSAGVAVSNIILHESGQWVQFDPLFIPAAKQDAQGFGSASSYARRYAVKAAWNLADEDDDGNAAVQKDKPATFTASAPTPTKAAPAGYHYLSDYKQSGDWHEVHVLNWDAQGGAGKGSTRKKDIGRLLMQFAQDGTPVKLDITEKKGAKGEFYINKVNSYAVDQALAPLPIDHITPLNADDIPF